MRNFKFIFYLIATMIFMACTTKIQTNSKENEQAFLPNKTIFVAAETKACTGVAPMECLLVKTDRNQADWELFYSNIKGFDYEKGFEYELLINEVKIENPAADASSIQYNLVKIVNKSLKN